MTTTSYKIEGMTCGHCQAAVTKELTSIPGVSDVLVDLEAGTATVTSASDLSVDSVRAAIDEAGYELVDA